MENKIGIKLVETLSGIIDIGLDTEAADQRPYAVYSVRVGEDRTKGGVYRLNGTMDVTIYADTYAQVEQLAVSIKAAVASDMLNPEFRHSLDNEFSDSRGGVWEYHLEYNVSQYKI